MIGDPNTCRRHARRCIELANETTHDNLKRELMGLAATWVRLADELSRIRVIMDEVAKHEMAES
jgi:hypothetical protein